MSNAFIWFGALKKSTANVASHSLSDNEAANEVCVFEEELKLQASGGGVGDWRRGDYGDSCVIHEGKGVELH